jgi:DNA-binding MarR family transcriptional regulator
MAARDTDALRAELFGSVFLLAQHLTRRADRALEPLGLTAKQWLLLAVLARGFPGRSPTISEAAATYGSSRQNVKKIAEQLAAAGWLEIRPDADDGRALRLVLTAKVAAFDHPSGRARQAALFDEIFGALDGAALTSLHRHLARWIAALAPVE